jgi:predicted DNA-binding transcriptional regulator AlpA
VLHIAIQNSTSALENQQKDDYVCCKLIGMNLMQQDATTAPMRFLRSKQVLERVPVCRTTLWRMTEIGEFPKSVKVGSATFWIESEVEDWMQKKVQNR